MRQQRHHLAGIQAAEHRTDSISLPTVDEAHIPAHRARRPAKPVDSLVDVLHGFRNISRFDANIGKTRLDGAINLLGVVDVVAQRLGWIAHAGGKLGIRPLGQRDVKLSACLYLRFEPLHAITRYWRHAERAWFPFRSVSIRSAGCIRACKMPSVQRA